jgi:hypothetical protein
MPEKIYDPKRLTQELQDENLPVASVSSDGRVSFSRELSKSEKSKVETIIGLHDSNPTAFETRVEDLKAAGVDIETIVLALWDLIIKGDSSAATALKDKNI